MFTAAAVQGNAVAPSSVMNSRLFILSPHRRGRAASAGFRAERLGGLQVDHKLVLGRRLHR